MLAFRLLDVCISIPSLITACSSTAHWSAAACFSSFISLITWTARLLYNDQHFLHIYMQCARESAGRTSPKLSQPVLSVYHSGELPIQQL